jgi:hypothetical protein
MYDDLYEAYDRMLLEERLTVHRDHKLLQESQRLDELPALSSMRRLNCSNPSIQLQTSASESAWKKSDGFERMKSCRWPSQFMFHYSHNCFYYTSKPHTQKKAPTSTLQKQK